MTNSRIVSIVRALAERVDPARVLRDVVAGALADTGCDHGMLAGTVDGRVTPLVASGAPHAVLLDAAGRATATGAASRMSDPGPGMEAVAVPIRVDSQVVAALGVAGVRSPEPEALLAYADCAALALGIRPPAPRGGSGPALAELLAGVAAAEGRDDVLRVALEVAEAAFGARSALVCLLEETPGGRGGTGKPGGPDAPGLVADVARYRGIDRTRLAEAARHPDFVRLVSGDSVRVLPPTDPVVARLSSGAEFAACVPFEGGAAVLLLSEAPDADRLRSLEAYRRQVSASLRAARLAGDLEAAGDEVARVVRFLPDPVVVVDDAGRFRVINAAAAELFSLSEPFEIGRPARGRLGHPELESLLLGEGDRAGLEVALGRPQPRRWRATGQRIGPPGEPGGHLLMLREARRRHRDEWEFLASVGRELRREVNALRGELALLGVGDTSVGERIDTLEATTDQLALVDGDLPFALRREAHDVVALVGAVVAQYRDAHPGRGLIITSHPVRIDAMVDRRLLDRALRPLLDNALAYSEGPVAVEVSGRGEDVEVAVIDAGPGIFSGDLPGLFERFHPLDGSAARRGLGLGLFTARRLVEAMEGRIWCDSRLGVGSRFAFRIPHLKAGDAPAGLAV